MSSATSPPGRYLPKSLTVKRPETLDKGCKKKRKPAELKGRKVHDAYHMKTLDQPDNKNPVAAVCDAILSVLPIDAQRNIKHTF
eukprot:evm.model.scf_2431.2 EVM.evm.TU.scf_2431.2   scf_2431:9001-10948(+)